jgi:hypothetical protein
MGEMCKLQCCVPRTQQRNRRRVGRRHRKFNRFDVGHTTRDAHTVVLPLLTELPAFLVGTYLDYFPVEIYW